jgi:hypothetical protein
VALFVGSECGDLACGAIAFRLSQAADAARWSDFAYENGYDEARTDFDSYSAIGPFEFAIDAYRTVIMTAASAPTGLEPTAASACDRGRNPPDGG